MSPDEHSARLADAIEADAWSDMFAAAPPALGLAVERVADATVLLAPRLPVMMFNRVIGLGVSQPATPATVDAIDALLRERAADERWVHVSPVSEPAEIADWLRARGYVLARRPAWVKVLRGTEAPPVVATAFTVRPVRADERGALAATITTAHGMPRALAPWIEALAAGERWTAYGAFDGEALVSGAMLYTHQDQAWLGLGGTLPTHRNRGAQGALMARRITDALARGCVTIATETGAPTADEANPSLSNMFRCGFKTVCLRENYAAPRRASDRA